MWAANTGSMITSKMKNEITKPKTIKTAIIMLLFGAAMGVIAKWLDINTQFLQITSSLNLANVFSEMSIWILIGTLISIYSKTKGRAALNVFVFCKKTPIRI